MSIDHSSRFGTNTTSDGRFVTRRITWDAVIRASVRRGCKPTVFIMQMELAGFGDRNGEACRPSFPTVARHCAISLNTARTAAKWLEGEKRIVPTGRDQRGICVYRLFLPSAVPEHINRLMVLRAFQHRLPPLERALLVCIAASADGEGRTNGHCPPTKDFAVWFDLSRNTVARGLNALAEMGLIRRVTQATGRNDECHQYDLTLSAEAMAWTPGRRPEPGTMPKIWRGACVNSGGDHAQNLEPTNVQVPTTKDQRPSLRGSAPGAAPDNEVAAERQVADRSVPEPKPADPAQVKEAGELVVRQTADQAVTHAPSKPVIAAPVATTPPPAQSTSAQHGSWPTPTMHRFAARNGLSDDDRDYVTDAVLAKLGTPPPQPAARGEWSAAWFAIAKRRAEARDQANAYGIAAWKPGDQRPDALAHPRDHDSEAA